MLAQCSDRVTSTIRAAYNSYPVSSTARTYQPPPSSLAHSVAAWAREYAAVAEHLNTTAVTGNAVSGPISAIVITVTAASYHLAGLLAANTMSHSVLQSQMISQSNQQLIDLFFCINFVLLI